MKNLPKSISLVCIFIFVAHLPAQKIKIVPEKNPWTDNYLSVCKMENYQKWGTYNVHDPSCLLVGDTYYMFSTDAIYGEDRQEIKDRGLPFGYIQVRKSKDLVNWKFVGWAFKDIPAEARQWVLSQSGGTGATNIWAPYILKYKDKYRLYYSVSAFGMQTSYIGLAEADSPEGPWVLKGCVVKTKVGDDMNAIDPSIITEPRTGRQWMHYGSFFGGLHAVQINPETGLTSREGDQGILTARRFNAKVNNIEAPEIIYNPSLKKYFLFVSYDPLMTTYNVRVGRSDFPEGPFFDFFGKDMREESDNYPTLIYPYRFDNHPGWAGTAHCSVFRDSHGEFFMAHQGRLSPDNHQMVLHVRQVFWTEDGWPTLSPERYAATAQQQPKEVDLCGDWELITIKGRVPERKLEAGQIMWGENLLKHNEADSSRILTFHADRSVTGALSGNWKIKGNRLELFVSGKKQQLHVFLGHDWENEKRTLLFSGINDQGRSMWGKKVR
jgi:arabinan endo-1,5-alpha-L-arabinosidase